MKNTSILTLMVLVSALFFVSCSVERISDEDFGQVIQTNAKAKGAIKYVPYIENGTLSPTTDPNADIGVECEGDLFEIFNKKIGKASHLGKIIGFENSCVNFATGEVSVTGVNIASNGDHLYFVASCGFTSPTDFTCDLTIMGGSGRFENASNPPGEPIIVEGTFDPATGVSNYNSHGKISSNGSTK